MKKSIFLALLATLLFGARMSAQTYSNEGAFVRTSYSQVESTYNGEPPYYLVNRKLTMNDLYGLNCQELRVLRNALFAYHGYIFDSDDLYYMYSKFYWYNPRYTSASKVLNMMNKTEKYNINFIKKREKQLGCR